MVFGLVVILALVLIMPFASKKVEENLEPFLFVMGLAAVITSRVLNWELVVKALEEPFLISLAVLIAGLIFHLIQRRLKGAMDSLLKRIPTSLFLFLVVLVLGLASSLITAIIASLVLVEIVGALKFDRRSEVGLVVIACFAIGLGAALTPVGEPLATIATSKLHGNFLMLLSILGAYVIPSIFALALLAAFYVRPRQAEDSLSEEQVTESYLDVFLRAIKVYLFVMALVFLGEGFKPVIDIYVIGLDSKVLYWINMISAVLDNATLTAAEISDLMHPEQVKAVLMGLLISGGMLIPGNIPNIISSSKLKIKSWEWARLGVPLGLIIMVIFFVILLF